MNPIKSLISIVNRIVAPHHHTWINTSGVTRGVIAVGIAFVLALITVNNVLAQTVPTLVLKTSSDTGASDSDGITKDNTPTITISGVAGGAAIIITATKSGETSVTATRNGNGDVTLTTLADGDWEITAPTSTAITITIDTQAPTVVLSSPDGESPVGPVYIGVIERNVRRVPFPGQSDLKRLAYSNQIG